MVAISGGEFMMGSDDDPAERPVHRVAIRPFLIGKYPVTVAEWKACVAAGGCEAVPTRDDDATPIDNVSWADAQKFAAWLSSMTGKAYRLPSESEWEYAARAGTRTKYWWGNEVQPGMANCKGCGEPYDARQPLRYFHFGSRALGRRQQREEDAEDQEQDEQDPQDLAEARARLRIAFPG